MIGTYLHGPLLPKNVVARGPPDRAGARRASSSRSTTSWRTPRTSARAGPRASRVAAMARTAFVTGGSGFIGGALDPAPGGRGLDRAGAGALGPLRRRRARARRRARQRRPRRRGGHARGAEGADVDVPRRGVAGRLGQPRVLRARQRAAAPATRCRRRARPASGASCTWAPRRRSPTGKPLVQDRREQAADAPTRRRSTAPPRRRPSRPCATQRASMGGDPPAPRLGARRHHDPPGPRRGDEERPLRLDRRRRAPDLDHPCGQRGRGADARRREGRARLRLLRH